MHLYIITYPLALPPLRTNQISKSPLYIPSLLCLFPLSLHVPPPPPPPPHPQVCYTVTGWLNKNKDPLNDSVVDLLKKSTDSFIAGLWMDYSLDGERGRGKKGSQFVTVGQLHKQSLNHLLTTLREFVIGCIFRETLLNTFASLED